MTIMRNQELIPHLFRTEFSRITAVLCRHFGIEHIQVAEDIAGETFLAALETWPYKGIPQNPVAWLYTVAKNKAKNQLARQQLFTNRIAPHIRIRQQEDDIAIDLSESNIADSQLQMLFTLCHPSIPAEAQISLSLRILCGFGIEEIATAFLTNKETVNKRLLRAKEKLRHAGFKIEMPNETEMPLRLQAVLTTLYLLFNEGYYSESGEYPIREDLCLEAMRLTHLLLKNENTALTPVYALLALMCFQASRFRARKNECGDVVLYDDQDEKLWDQELIAKGAYYLHMASKGNLLSKYHLEANIASWYTIKQDSPEKWQQVLQLYNRLLQFEYSPVAALNRTYAYSKVYGKEKGIEEAEKLQQLEKNHYYFTLLGVLNTGTDNEKARINFERALLFARSKTDRHSIQKKIEGLNDKHTHHKDAEQ